MLWAYLRVQCHANGVRSLTIRWYRAESQGEPVRLQETEICTFKTRACTLGGTLEQLQTLSLLHALKMDLALH